MTDLIHVQPTTANRRAFARWAVAQTPKIGTIGLFVFGVPPHLFVEAPEHLLIGAIVDGHRYVSPDEDAAAGIAGPGELLGVATPDELTPPAETPQAGAPLENAGAAAGGDSSDPSDPPPGDYAPPDEGEGPPYACDQCTRAFDTERGRDTHRRQAHREARDAG